VIGDVPSALHVNNVDPLRFEKILGDLQSAEASPPAQGEDRRVFEAEEDVPVQTISPCLNERNLQFMSILVRRKPIQDERPFV
jgi:hypothetical protein